MTPLSTPNGQAGSGTMFGWSLTAAYIAPVLVFGLLTAAEGYLPGELYPGFYVLKALVVTATLVLTGRIRADIRPSSAVIVPAVVTGLVVLVAWLAIEQIPYPHIGTRMAFNPFQVIQSPAAAAGFIAVRLYGLVLMVPVMEELFWRSFLLKYLSDVDLAAPPGARFSPNALWTMIGLSALAHPEWLAAIVASGIYTVLLYRTKSLFAAVVAHAVTNAGLGLYILMTGNWQLW